MPAHSSITSAAFCHLHCSVTLLFIVAHIHCVAALSLSHTSYNHLHHFNRSFRSLWHIFNNTIICKTHTFSLTKCTITQSHTHTQACTQWASVYLRLLLLGCEPARPGWSGLWRFWRGTENQQSSVNKVYSCRFKFSGR